MMLFDAHNHLQDAWLAPHRARVFADLAQLPLGRSVVNGTCQQDWPQVAKLAGEHGFILPSFGLHPWYVGNSTPAWRDEWVRSLDTRQRAGADVAIGEVGLDRWILDRARPDDARLAGLRRASLEEQIDAFRWQLALAADRNLPITIHCIDAWGALLEVLQRSRRPARGFLLHAYGGSTELARDFAALGAFFSFNGYFLGERQAAKRAVFAGLPADRLLVETDAPAMPPPEGFRAYSLPGFADDNPINHPANLGKIYEGLAAVRHVSLVTLATEVAENFRRLFGNPDREKRRPESGDGA
jgi:TatD DNase family protein